MLSDRSRSRANFHENDEITVAVFIQFQVHGIIRCNTGRSDLFFFFFFLLLLLFSLGTNALSRRVIHPHKLFRGTCSGAGSGKCDLTWNLIARARGFHARAAKVGHPRLSWISLRARASTLLFHTPCPSLVSLLSEKFAYHGDWVRKFHALSNARFGTDVPRDIDSRERGEVCRFIEEF